MPRSKFYTWLSGQNSDLRMVSTTMGTLDGIFRKTPKVVSHGTHMGSVNRAETNITYTRETNTESARVNADTRLVKAIGKNEQVNADYINSHQEIANDPDLDLSKKDARRLRKIDDDIADAKKASANGQISQEQQDAIVKDHNFDPARYDKIKNLGDNIQKSQDLQAASQGLTRDFIDAMKDATAAAPNSPERGDALADAWKALAALRDDQGVIHLHPDALKYLPEQHASNRRNQPVADPLSSKSPSQLMMQVSGVMAADEFNPGTAITAADITKLKTAQQLLRNGTTSVDNKDDNTVVTADPKKTEELKKQDELKKQQEIEKLKKDDLDKQLAERKKQEDAVELKLEASNGKLNAGEKGVAGQVPKIAANQVDDLQDALVALAADGKHPAAKALADRLTAHPDQKGKFGKLTLAALAEANGTDVAAVKDIDFTNADASKAVLAKINPKKLPDFVAKPFVPTADLTTTTTTAPTTNTAAKTGLDKLSTDQTKALQDILVKDGLLTAELANGTWGAEQTAAVRKELEKINTANKTGAIDGTGRPSFDIDAFLKDPTNVAHQMGNNGVDHFPVAYTQPMIDTLLGKNDTVKWEAKADLNTGVALTGHAADDLDPDLYKKILKDFKIGKAGIVPGQAVAFDKLKEVTNTDFDLNHDKKFQYGEMVNVLNSPVGQIKIAGVEDWHQFSKLLADKGITKDPSGAYTVVETSEVNAQNPGTKTADNSVGKK